MNNLLQYLKGEPVEVIKYASKSGDNATFMSMKNVIELFSHCYMEQQIMDVIVKTNLGEIEQIEANVETTIGMGKCEIFYSPLDVLQLSLELASNNNNSNSNIDIDYSYMSEIIGSTNTSDLDNDLTLEEIYYVLDRSVPISELDRIINYEFVGFIRHTESTVSRRCNKVVLHNVKHVFNVLMDIYNEEIM